MRKTITVKYTGLGLDEVTTFESNEPLTDIILECIEQCKDLEHEDYRVELRSSNHIVLDM